MGNKLFGVNISKLIKDNVGPGVLDAILIKSTPGTRTPGSLSSGTQPTEVSYTCKGFIDTQRTKFVNGALVKSGSKVVVLVGDTINGGDPASAPSPGDRITIEGDTYQISAGSSIDRDPAAAVYTCEVDDL